MVTQVYTLQCANDLALWCSGLGATLISGNKAVEPKAAKHGSEALPCGMLVKVGMGGKG